MLLEILANRPELGFAEPPQPVTALVVFCARNLDFQHDEVAGAGVALSFEISLRRELK